MNKKTVAILEGIGTIVLGVLIAVFGGLAVLDIYFGIIFLVAGAALLIFHFVEVAKKMPDVNPKINENNIFTCIFSTLKL